MSVPIAALQEAAPGAIIELYELQLNTLQHGASTTYRFHAGANLNANGEVVWAGNAYLRFPVEIDGFAYSGRGALPRPTLRIANLTGTITALLLTLPNGLEGAKVTRLRTLARYLDAVNFPGGVNPYGTPDPTALFPSEIYYIDRKSTENRDVIEFELASAFDLANVRAPKRQCISNICQWQYKSVECGYGYRNPAAAAAAVNVTTNEITLVAHGMVTGDLMRIATTPGNTPMTINGTLLAQDGITNLVASNLRYAIKTSNDSFILASTQARAFAGLSDDIQSAGTGTHTFQTGFYQRDDTQAPAPSDDVCGKQVSSCKFRFGASAELAFGSYPGIGTFYV